MTAENPAMQRRTVLGLAIATGAAAASGCSTYGTGTTTVGPGTPTDAPTDAPAGGGRSDASPVAAAPLAATSDVPVGGGTILADHQIVLAQPTAGEFKAYTAVCTHQGCTVASIAKGLIICPCHGSRFRLSDGGVDTGPARQPLASIAITVTDGRITRA